MTAAEHTGFRLNAPNLLSLIRVPLAALFWISQDWIAIFGIIAAAAISDLLDGFVARKTGVHDDTGAWLDPLCDKVFMMSVLVATFVWREPPLVMVAAIGAREILQVPLLVLYTLRRTKEVHFNFKAGWPGKITTVLQFVAVMLLLIERPEAAIAAAACAALGIYSVIYYLQRALKARREFRSRSLP